MRAVAGVLAITYLALGCALFMEPAPPGTMPVTMRLTNNSADVFPLEVRRGPGDTVVPGAVQPATTVLASSRVSVTVYVPIDGSWSISLGTWGEIPSEHVLPEIRRGRCSLVVEINADGSGSYGCQAPPS